MDVALADVFVDGIVCDEPRTSASRTSFDGLGIEKFVVVYDGRQQSRSRNAVIKMGNAGVCCGRLQIRAQCLRPPYRFFEGKLKWGGLGVRGTRSLRRSRLPAVLCGQSHWVQA